MDPDAATLAAGGPVELDVGKVAPGQQVMVRWRDRPVFITHRTPEALQKFRDPALLADVQLARRNLAAGDTCFERSISRLRMAADAAKQ